MSMRCVPLPLPDDLRSIGLALAKRAGTSRNHILRECIRAGIPAVEKSLAEKPGRLFPNIPPLPKGALARWYRSKESKAWDKVEEAFTRARPTPAYEQ